MIRKVLGFAAIAVAGIVTLNVVMAVLGLVVGLVFKILWLAVIGFAIYMVYKMVTRPRPADAGTTGQA